MSAPAPAPRTSWRSVAATWGGAMLLLMRQFGVPGPTGALRETDIVRVAEAADLLAARERAPDGRILTLPVESSLGQRQDGRRVSCDRFAVN